MPWTFRVSFGALISACLSSVLAGQEAVPDWVVQHPSIWHRVPLASPGGAYVAEPWMGVPVTGPPCCMQPPEPASRWNSKDTSLVDTSSSGTLLLLAQCDLLS